MVLTELDGTTLDGLSITIDPPAVPMRVDGDLGVTVRLRNTGTERIEFLSGAPTVIVVEAGTRTEVGRFLGGLLGVGITVALVPGDEQTLDGVVGLAPCDPADGYRVPRGVYELIALVQGPDPTGPPC